MGTQFIYQCGLGQGSHPFGRRFHLVSYSGAADLARPARYTKLSERLDNILKELTGKWDQLSIALEQLLKETTDEHGAGQVHDDPLVARFYGVLEAEFATDSTLPADKRVDIAHVAEDIVVEVVSRASIVRFWHNSYAQEALRKHLIHMLDDSDLFPFEEQTPLADKLMELAKANQSLIASRRP